MLEQKRALITRLKEIQAISDTELKESRLRSLLDDLKIITINVGKSEDLTFVQGFYNQVKGELKK